VQRWGVASGGQLDGVVNSMGDYVTILQFYSYEARLRFSLARDMVSCIDMEKMRMCSLQIFEGREPILMQWRERET
jgi:hypothetical protein